MHLGPRVRLPYSPRGLGIHRAPGPRVRFATPPKHSPAVASTGQRLPALIREKIDTFIAKAKGRRPDLMHYSSSDSDVDDDRDETFFPGTDRPSSDSSCSSSASENDDYLPDVPPPTPDTPVIKLKEGLTFEAGGQKTLQND